MLLQCRCHDGLAMMHGYHHQGPAVSSPILHTTTSWSVPLAGEMLRKGAFHWRFLDKLLRSQHRWPSRTCSLPPNGRHPAHEPPHSCPCCRKPPTSRAPQQSCSHKVDKLADLRHATLTTQCNAEVSNVCVKWNLVVLIPKNKQKTSHRTWFVDTLKLGWLEPTSLRMCVYICVCVCV